jgi:general secretion pathway protein N
MAMRNTGLALWVVAAVVLSTEGLARPPDGSETELQEQPRADAPAVSSVFDQPASPAQPVVVVRPPPDTPRAAPERALSANPLWEIPLASLSNTRERPVFSPSRRPPPLAIAAPPPTREPPPPPRPPRAERPELSLVGTIAGDDESFGIFVDQTTKAALRLKVGEDYQGWKLRAVEGREVTLEHDRQTATLSLPQPGTLMPGPALPRLKADSAPAQGQAEPALRQRDERR